MHLGICYWATDQTITPGELAVEAEARGFESIWIGDHSHIPVSRRTPYPAGGDLAPEYSRFVDPFVGLATAAAVTTRIKIGTAICLVAEHDPIMLAKQVATLDRLSDARFLFGIGYGWNREAMEDHGVDPDRRYDVVREKLAAMRELWTKEESFYKGEHVSFEPTWFWPKPLQQPYPPVLIGGNGQKALRHVIEFGDGWIPVAGQVVQKMEALRAAADEAGRDASKIEVSVTAPRVSTDALEHYRAAGVARVMLFLEPPCHRDDVLPRLDEWACFIPQVAA